jgi:glyoxylase-like metal-dependent hydrolase (beta-lactamase superfamily II)
MEPTMRLRSLSAVCCIAVVGVGAWLGSIGRSGSPASEWAEVAPGILRSKEMPAGYAIVDGKSALLIDAPQDPDGLKKYGVEKIETVLLTHHHRDTCAFADKLLAGKVPVRAPKAGADWLTPENVRKFWQGAVPLPNSRVGGYLVVPEGFEGIDCSLVDGQKIEWHGWTIAVVATPGHSKDHVAFAVQKDKKVGPIVFAGDALAEPGKLWTPYTTDWDHWTDVGLKPTAESLRKLAKLQPSLLLPAHGAPIDRDCAAALEKTAKAVEEVGFLKSFERFTKQRLGDAPEYKFLVKEQFTNGGGAPRTWSKVSPHLWCSGNTFVLISKDENAFLTMDPWGKPSAQRIAELTKDQKLGKLEVVLFSHAHFDHYDGIHELPDREKYEVWALDRVAAPIADPYLVRAPFLDGRPVKFDRRFKDGDTATWREYKLRFWHFPGQTEFTMAVETTIDGKHCLFTADNFFHQDQFSGSGGWMGMNRSFPLSYATSAQKVLDVAPEWVLAEHGGPFEFNGEDFRRRVRWGKEAAKAADAICVTGNHRRDWDPNRIHVRPLLRKAKPGDTVEWTVVALNPLAKREALAITLVGRDLTADQTFGFDLGAGETQEKPLRFRLSEKAPAGRHVLTMNVRNGAAPAGADAILVVDVEPAK